MMDLNTVGQAALRGLKPGRPLRDPTRLFRVAAGMIVAAAGGYFLHDFTQQVLVCVGAFLGGIAALMPHNRSRLVAAILTGVAEVGAAAVGVLVHGRWWLILAVVFAGFFAAGLLRVVAIGISMRTLVVTIIFLAFAEITPSLQVGAGEIALFGIGVAIMVLAQLLPPYEPRHAVQRQAVAAFYEALAAGGAYGPALLAADRSLALLRRRRHREIERLMHLVERGEEIAQLEQALDNRADDGDAWRPPVTDRLRTVATWIRRNRTGERLDDVPAPPGADRLHAAIVAAVNAATRTAAGGDVPPRSDERHPPTAWELVRDELHPASPILHHALRLAATGIVGELLGLAIGIWAGPGVMLHGHGFWVVVAVALILFPDYGETLARGIGRTVGTVAGAVVGVALSFLPANPVLPTAILIVLFLGYLAFRSCGQPWTMFWVVAWISSLTIGPLGAVTRGVETIVGCVLAFAVYLMVPTYQRRRLSALIGEWMLIEADRLDALGRLWSRPGEQQQLDVARSTVRSRLTRLEIVEAGHQASYEPADRAGRWPNADIETSLEDMVAIARQVAVIAVLAPEPDGTPRPGALPAADLLASELRGPAGPGSSIDQVDVPDPDLRIAIEHAYRAIAGLSHTTRRQPEPSAH